MGKRAPFWGRGQRNRGGASTLFLILVVALLPLSVAHAQSEGFTFSTSPALFPSYSPRIRDYVFRGVPNQSLQLSVTLPPGGQASVDGQPTLTKSFVMSVPLQDGQRASLTVTLPGEATATYNIRRLPPDFPAFSVRRNGTPQAEWYTTSPTLAFGQMDFLTYAIVFDSHGAPIWWFHNLIVPYDVKPLDGQTIAWTEDAGIQIRNLSGALLREVTPVGGVMDFHELVRLENGNFLLIANPVLGPMDLTSIGGSATAPLINNTVEEITPTGEVAWSWSSFDHLPLTMSDRNLWQDWIQMEPSDPYHMNDIEPDGDGYVMSFRHLNAVMKVKRDTGEVEWQLGGAPTDRSLAFVGDSRAGFGGQHDARILPDGTLTLYDNASRTGLRPRVVRYRLDLDARTATLIEEHSDPVATVSLCCGSARKLSGGNWVTTWGANPYFTEMTDTGETVFRVTFDGFFPYRTTPVPYGVMARSDLVAGMDAQFPRTPPATEVACLPGDATGDGRVDIADVVALLRAVVGVQLLDAAPFRAGDVNRDGKLSVVDALIVLRALTHQGMLPPTCLD